MDIFGITLFKNYHDVTCKICIKISREFQLVEIDRATHLRPVGLYIMQGCVRWFEEFRVGFYALELFKIAGVGLNK